MSEAPYVASTWPVVNLWPAYIDNQSHIGNNTIDVIHKDCFNDFDVIACARNSVLSFLVLITGFMCVLKLCRLHLSKHYTWHQYAVFYCATLECLLCSVHWVVSKGIQPDFVIKFLRLVQFVIVSHLYWTLAARALKKEKLIRRVVTPVLSVALLYFTVVTVLGCVYVKPSWIECLQPYWLALSAAEFALVQLFMVAGIYISRRLNEISTLQCVRLQQQRDLWILIVVFEGSALAGLVYDITMQILGNETEGCSGVFLQMQEIYTGVIAGFVIVKLLVPIWAMLFVFKPSPSHPEGENYLPAIAGRDGNYRSVFDPPYDRQISHQGMSIPGNEYQASDPSFSSSPFSSSSGSTTPVFSTPRRTSSNLATIHEEDMDEQAHRVCINDRTHLIA